ncbi:MAG: D-alanine--D-alanine ligase [Parcubacteria group bacterium]|nr:D-alanine--D-alanine ligase [Parcubacteria group bacterium]
MTTIRVGVLRGGPSSEYHVSLETGKQVLENLPLCYAPVDILISRDGTWHVGGLPTKPQQVFRLVDVIFNALHGQYGEDGTVQELLEHHKVPFTGSGRVASALAMQKHLARAQYEQAALAVPRAVSIAEEEEPQTAVTHAVRLLPPPWIVKPAAAGSSVGITKTTQPAMLPGAIASAREHSAVVLIEECIQGRELTCGVLEHFRGEKQYALPAIEIIPKNKERLFDFTAKYDGSTKEICPAPLVPEIKTAVAGLAKRAHELLGCRDYSRSDMILTPKGKLYLLETNTLPGLTKESLLPKAASAIGLSFPKLLDHLLRLASERR